MPDPVSWKVIEPGWAVVDASGEAVGTVDEVTGSAEEDIFDGLAVVSNLFAQPKYVPSEAVGTITEGRIQLTIGRDAFAREQAFAEPPSSEEILPEKASLAARTEEALVGGERDRAQRVPFLRRLYVLLLGRRRGNP